MPRLLDPALDLEGERDNEPFGELCGRVPRGVGERVLEGFKIDLGEAVSADGDLPRCLGFVLEDCEEASRIKPKSFS